MVNVLSAAEKLFISTPPSLAL